MIIQFFGMDAKRRNDLAQAVGRALDAWVLIDTELPMAHNQDQYARWLRVVGKLYKKNYHKDIILNGFFATANAREEFRNEHGSGSITQDISIFVETVTQDALDTIPGYKERPSTPGVFEMPEPVEVRFWQQPSPEEYDVHIVTTGDPEQDSLEHRVAQVLDAINDRRKFHV